ncbi:unnamed protein product, partial [Rotaria sp. Silwood1]
MKLFLAILSFSTTYTNTSTTTFSSTKQILDIQDRYIELTWKYLLYKYNSNQAVKYFSNLIRCVLAIHDALAKADEVQWFTEEIDFLV